VPVMRSQEHEHDHEEGAGHLRAEDQGVSQGLVSRRDMGPAAGAATGSPDRDGLAAARSGRERAPRRKRSEASAVEPATARVYHPK
jgi:hypothetical protein